MVRFPAAAVAKYSPVAHIVFVMNHAVPLQGYDVYDGLPSRCRQPFAVPAAKEVALRRLPPALRPTGIEWRVVKLLSAPDVTQRDN